MKGYIQERAIELARSCIDMKWSIKMLSKKYGISKSTVRNDLLVRLPELYTELAEQVKEVLEEIRNSK
jgi:putative DeoR family transcriptional regulator (stage III sporulation protein D)